MGSNYYDPSGAIAGLLVFYLVMFIFAIGLYVLQSWFLMKIFQKAGVQGAWRAWVPVYNSMVFLKLGDVSPWLVLYGMGASILLGWIPFLNFLVIAAVAVPMALAAYRIGLKFGKEPAWVVLYILVSIVWEGILAFDQSRFNKDIAPAGWAGNSFFADNTVWEGVPVQTPAGYAPGYGASGYGAPQYGAPQYGAPQAPGYGAPQPPQYGAPQYGAPQAPQYGAPQYGAPEAPQYGAPEAPNYGAAPEAPHYGAAPEAPQYGAPEAPQYGAPEAPQSGAPQYGAPQYGAPEAPQYGAPEAPQYGAPEAPQYGVPEVPPAPAADAPAVDFGSAQPPAVDFGSEQPPADSKE